MVTIHRNQTLRELSKLLPLNLIPKTRFLPSKFWRKILLMLKFKKFWLLSKEFLTQLRPCKAVSPKQEQWDSSHLLKMRVSYTQPRIRAKNFTIVWSTREWCKRPESTSRVRMELVLLSALRVNLEVMILCNHAQLLWLITSIKRNSLFLPIIQWVARVFLMLKSSYQISSTKLISLILECSSQSRLTFLSKPISLRRVALLLTMRCSFLTKSEPIKLQYSKFPKLLKSSQMMLSPKNH